MLERAKHYSNREPGRDNPESVDVHQKLVSAVGENDLETLRSLMAQGVDPDIPGEATDCWGHWGHHYPLCWAAKSGSVEAVKVLLDHGAKVNIHNLPEGGGETPLYCAVKSGVADIVRILIDKGADINALSDGGLTPLYLAVWRDSREIVDMLQANGADPSIPVPVWRTPLFNYAVEKGYVDIVNQLLANGVDPDTPCERGFRPLYLAVKGAHAEIIDALLDNGANPAVADAQNRVWRSSNQDAPAPLFYLAIKRGVARVVEALLASGVVDPNTPVHKWQKPLHLAIASGDSKTVKALLDYGADPNGVNYDGVRPLQSAIDHGQGNIVELLVAGGGHVDAFLMNTAIMRGNIQIVGAFLANGVDPNRPRRYQTDPNPLSVAVAHGSRIDMVKMLLANGADPNALNRYGQTPLYQSVNRVLPYKEMVDLLLANHADPDVLNKNDFAGVSVPAELNKAAHTVLEVARLRRHINIVKKLENHMPVPYQPPMLKVCARACIRGRLVQNRANLAKTLSAESDCLPLPVSMKAFLYHPLSF